MKPESKQVGPFTVKALTVGEGLQLMTVADDPKLFQREIIAACVQRDGKSIMGDDFREVVPLLPELFSAAMELNGFNVKS